MAGLPPHVHAAEEYAGRLNSGVRGKITPGLDHTLAESIGHKFGGKRFQVKAAVRIRKILAKYKPKNCLPLVFYSRVPSSILPV